MTRRIIQFGTSRFLQAHVDLFVHEARRLGDDIGPITVVKTSSAQARSRSRSKGAEKRGHPVFRPVFRRQPSPSAPRGEPSDSSWGTSDRGRGWRAPSVTSKWAPWEPPALEIGKRGLNPINLASVRRRLPS